MKVIARLSSGIASELNRIVTAVCAEAKIIDGTSEGVAGARATTERPGA